MTAESSRKKIGFVGLGNMGGPMAVNIAKAGFELTVYDVRKEPLAEMKALGAGVAATTRELGERSDIVMIVVVNDSQLEEVVYGKQSNEGILAGCKPGTIMVIHSTVQPETCKRIAASAEAKGVAVVDAPVSGGEMASRAGTLSLMMGGDPAHIAACQPVFEVVSKNRFQVGGVGTGQVAKLANNVVAMINLEATREGLRLARLAGVDESTMLEILKVSTGNSWMVQNWEARKKVVETYTTGKDGIGKVRYKDMMLALAAGYQVGAVLPMTALVTQFTHKASND
jgi:3-hydroxyisobutyrate dehydrogenase-like beta-hydroxyacid dehydrogenase